MTTVCVTIAIQEGQQFTVGKVDVTGKDVPTVPEDALSKLATKPGETFEASTLRDDVQLLTDRMSEDGYAFAKIEPQTQIDLEKKEVNVNFQVERGAPVTVERIEVTGNTKTRDYVVRREMRLQEGELFSGTRLRKSREALQRVGFFSEVNVTTRKGAAEDKMHVLVDVKEAQTGAFSAGAGFSSADNLLFNVRIQENNLFGRGQRLLFNADVGSIRRNIIVSFTEPYLAPADRRPRRVQLAPPVRRVLARGTGASVSFTIRDGLGLRHALGLPLEEYVPASTTGSSTPRSTTSTLRDPVDPARRGVEHRQQRHPEAHAEHAQPRLRPDRGIVSGPVGRDRRPRRHGVREGRGAEPLVLHVLEAQELG